MAIKFGAKQLKNPTPKFLKTIFRGYTFLAGLWAIFGQGLFHLPEDITALINKILLTGVPVIQYTIKFFGLDYDLNEQQSSLNQFQPNKAFQVKNYLDVEMVTGKTCYELANLYPDIYALINDDNGNPNFCIYSTVPLQYTFIDHTNQQSYAIPTVDFVGGRPVGR